VAAQRVGLAVALPGAGVSFQAMKTVEQWRWYVRSLTGRVIKTRYHMSEEEALARDKEARRVEGSRRVIQVAETREELVNRTHSSWGGR
jgi:hypothetical protein